MLKYTYTYMYMYLEIDIWKEELMITSIDDGGMLEQANTLVTPADRNNLSTIGFVPRTTFLLELSWPVYNVVLILVQMCDSSQ